MTGKEPSFLGLFIGDPHVMALKAGESLFKKGDAAHEAFVLLSGELRLGDTEAVLPHLQPGAMVGEMGLIDHEPRSVSVVAVTDCTLVKINEKHFLALVQKMPSFALSVMRLMSRRLRNMNEIVKS